MKHVKQNKLAVLLALASIPFLVGCGPNNPNNQPGVGGVWGAQYGASSCVPITSPISFTSTNLYFSNLSVIAQGNQSQVVAGAPGGPYVANDAAISLSVNITPLNQTMAYPTNGLYPSYGSNYGSAANATGILRLSQQLQNKIKMDMGMYQTYPNTQPGYNAGPCVDDIAFDLGRDSHNPYLMRGGMIWLKFNDGRGYQIPVSATTATPQF